MKIKKSTAANLMMTGPLVVVLVIILIFACFSAAHCQTVLFPSRLHLGERNTLLVLSNDDPTNSITTTSSATLELFSKESPSIPLLSEQIQFTQGQLTEVSFPFEPTNSGGNFPPTQSEDIIAVVTFPNGVTRSAFVEVSPENGFIYLQTDKPIYKVEDTVRFRVLRLDRHLRPLSEHVLLRISNHQKIKVEEAVLVTGPPMHIAEHRFNFPLIAKPGTWTADVLYGPKHTLVASTAFDVTQYILPAFKIDFTLPKFIFSTDTSVDIVMNVSYTFGKPVRGTVYYRYGITEVGGGAAAAEGSGADNVGGDKAVASSAPVINFFNSTNTFCFDGGVMRHQADISWIREHGGQYLKGSGRPLRFVVEATVRECATNTQEQSLDSSVAIVERPYSFGFGRTVRRYKPMVVNYLAFEILDPHGKPAPEVPFSLKITSTETRNPVALEHSIVSAENGFVVFSFLPPDNVRSYKVQLATTVEHFDPSQQTYASFILEPFRQTRIKKSSQLVDASLWIANKRGFSFQVGERFQSEVLAERLQGDTAYLLVMSRGAVVQWEKISLQSNSKHVNLLISNQMVPSVRLLLIATSEDGELLADSHRLTVSPGASCGGSLSVQLLKAGQQNQKTKRRKVYPGGNVTFQVEGGHRGDVLGFHAIDEAVYILRRGAENASLSSYSALLERADGGCGPGGAAASSAEVLRSAGFKVLSSSSVIDQQQFGVFSCAHKKKKARRVRKESGDEAKKKTTNSSTLEEAFRLWCCHLGEVKPSKQGSSEDLGCMDRAKIVERYTSRACRNEYLACCLRSTRNEFQASRDSASSSSSSSSNADSGNPSVENDDDFIDSGGVTVEHVRSDFRDTWLFDLVLLNQSGTQNITFTTPDSITNWAVRTLSITSREGFCLASGDPVASVTTFKPFFLKVRLPPTVVEHEQAEVQVTAFNYQSTGTTLNVTFERVKGLCSDWLRAPRATRELSIAPHSFAQTAFSLLPVKSGRFNVSIEAKSLLKGGDGFVDKVVKRLMVLTPGVVKEQQLTFDLDPQNRAKREARIETGLYVDETTGNEQKTRVKLRPKRGAEDESAMKNLGLDARYITSDSSASSNIVPDSLRYVVTAFGERYRPQLSSIEELSELIRKPKGCGEQNMYYAAFNLYSMVYLEQLGRLEPATRTKGVGYLKRALVQQLEFRKEDGSFATFRKRPASVWLTAFVAKTFCQAAPYLGDQLLDEQIVVTAIAWLQGRQKLSQPKPSDNGHFQEEHPVLHEKAMGGAKGRVPLTAYILTVLNQCRPYLNQIFTSSAPEEVKMASLNETIQQAETFVLANYQEVSDRSQAYRQALVAYALSYSESSEAANLKHKLTETLISSGSHDSKLNQKSWKDSAAWPVETAAYALLALITAGPPNGPKAYQQQVDLLGHPMSIANWLNAQQMRGTFDNTQDTIVALDALSRFYLLNKVNQEFEQEEQEEVVMGGGGRSRNRKRNGLQTDVLFDEQLKRSLRFNHSNADLLQTLPVDSETREISFKTTGNGLGKLSLLIIYNEFAPNGTNCRFDIDVDAYQYREQPIVHESHIEGRYFPSREKSKAKLYGELGITGNRTQRSMKEEANRRYLHASIGKQQTTSETSTNVQSCCEDTRLAARRRKRRNAALNSSKKEGGKGVDKELQSRRKRANHRLGLLPPLPVTSTQKPQVMVLSLCVRYHSVSEYQSDMAILEVGLLSGFRPVTRDLDLVLAEETYVVQYDVTTTKVVLYLRTVPTGRQYCFQFRLFQKYKVKKVQPALIRMYNYYEEEWTCTRFYSQTRVTAYMDYQCGGSTSRSSGNKDSPSWFSKNFASAGSEDAAGSSCKCVTRERCPGRTDVDNARRADGTLEDMRKLFCSFSHILIGTVQWVGNETFATEGGAGEKDSVVPVMDIRVDRKDQSAGVIFGQLKPTGKNRQLYQPTIRLYFHSECRYFVEAYSQSVGSRVLVMHSTKSRDPRWLVNGNSVLKVLDQDGYEEMKRYQSTLLSEDNCPKLNENT